MIDRPILALHIVGVITAVGAVVVTDVLTLVAKFRPKATKLVVLLSPFLSLIVWAGFFLLAVSGIALVYEARFYLDDPTFHRKMLLVGVVFVNGVVLNERIVPRFEELVAVGIYEPPTRMKLVAGVSATVSLVGWWGITYISYFELL